MLLRSQGRRHRSGPRAKLCHGTNAQPAACHRRPGRASLPCNEPRSLLTLQTKSPRWHVSRLSAAGHRHASPSGGGWRPNKTQGSACPLAHVGGFPGLRHSGNQKRNCGPLQGRGAQESRAEAITVCWTCNSSQRLACLKRKKALPHRAGPALLGMGSLTPTPGGSWRCFAIIRTFSGRGGRAAVSFRSAS